MEIFIKVSNIHHQISLISLNSDYFYICIKKFAAECLKMKLLMDKCTVL